MDQNGIKHICTTPYHPSSNGLAERAVQIFKQSLCRSSVREKISQVFIQVPNNSTFVHRSCTSWIVDGEIVMITTGLAQARFSNNSRKQSTEAKLAQDNKQPFRVLIEGEPVYV